MGAGVSLTVESSLGSWAEAWDALVERIPMPSPFLMSWWLESVARGRPRFLLVHRGHELIGGLALQLESGWECPIVRFLGDGPLCPDHLDAVAARGQEDEVVRALRSWWPERGPLLIDLRAAVPGSLVAATLPHGMRRDAFDVAPWASLPRHPEEYLAARSTNFRSNVRKASRRMAREGAEHRVVPRESLGQALATLRRLHADRWGTSPFLSDFDRFAAAAVRGADRGQFVLHELATGDATVASVACFEVAGRVSYYQAGRSPDPRWRGAGTVLLYEVVSDSCRRGLAEVDFLRGREPYKLEFAPEMRALVRLRAGVGRAGRLAVARSVVQERARTAAGRLVRPAIARLTGRDRAGAS
jgi:CelD/BcsL family acetyltransferase involved in cellulose biosynthesis